MSVFDVLLRLLRILRLNAEFEAEFLSAFPD